MSGDLETIIREAIPQRKEGAGKGGAKLVQHAIKHELESHGYVVDWEDRHCFLKQRMSVWQRCGDGCHIVEPTARRRRIDLVVYGNSDYCTPIALVEVESDLADMGRKTKKGYDIVSIANDAAGKPFSSYMSVERMAAAVQFWTMKQATGQYPNPLKAWNGCKPSVRIARQNITQPTPAYFWRARRQAGDTSIYYNDD